MKALTDPFRDLLRLAWAALCVAVTVGANHIKEVKTMWRIKLRSWYLNLKWIILWAVIYALGLEAWADERWYRRYL